MKLLLTRHGESYTNTDQHLTQDLKRVTNAAVTLTPNGITQAIDYAAWLKEQNLNPGAIITTHFSRAQQTSYLISSMLGSMPCIFYERDLGEINWGYQGHWHQVSDDYPDWAELSKNPDWQPEATYGKKKVLLESGRSVWNRAVPAMIRRVKKHKGRGDLLIVSHNYTLRALLAYLDGKGPQGMGEYDPRNLARHIYEIDPDRIDQVAQAEES